MKKMIISLIAWCFLGISLYWTVMYVDWHQLLTGAYLLGQHGEMLVLMSVGYATAFWLRSIGWSYQMGQGKVSVRKLWYYHHIGLFLNHALPVKGGEIARVALLFNREGFTWPEAIVSVGVSRILDMLGLIFIALTGVFVMSPELDWDFYGDKLWYVAMILVMLTTGVHFFYRLPWKKWTPRLVQKYPSLFLQPNWLALIATTCGWMLEAVVVWSVVYALGGQLNVGQALVVHVLTIIGQTFHITPGGIGTYETVMTTLLHRVAGHPLGFALEVAIISHGFKFVYSFVACAFVSWRLHLSPFTYLHAKESGENQYEKSFKI